MAPQSRYVRVRNDGWCYWSPFYSWSISHCHVTSTWFPFDEQYCDLVYESWKYSAQEMNFTTYSEGITCNGSGIKEDEFLPNDMWELIGKLIYERFCMYCDSLHRLK